MMKTTKKIEINCNSDWEFAQAKNPMIFTTNACLIYWLRSATNYIFRSRGCDQRMHGGCTTGAPRQKTREAFKK